VAKGSSDNMSVCKQASSTTTGSSSTTFNPFG
jgi:hypothetical protein